MLRNVEKVASDAGLYLSSEGDVWTYNEDRPHVRVFECQLSTCDEDDQCTIVGTVDGYRIAQDWTVKHDLEIWEEADSLDGDCVRYVEALIRELRACGEVFDVAPELVMSQRTTIVRHVQTAEGGDSANLTRTAVASVAMMDAPVLMLVDPWPMAEERRSPSGKLKGRSHVPGLLELGFVRMVGSRFLWAWNRELSDVMMADYSYEKLVAAKRKGALRTVLSSALGSEVHGPLPNDIAKMVDVPDPDDLMHE